MELSKRLQAVADLVSKDLVVADVGTDHGYIPIYLIEAQKCEKAFAMDINEGPLLRAKEHLAEKIEVRQSDGVKAMSVGECDSVVVAGMGGALVIKIMEDGKEIFRGLKEFVLQPQSELEKVRQYLFENEFCVIAENMVLEDGKYYPMMLAVRAGADWDVELENAQRKKHRLAEKLLQSGLTEKMCRFAGDWLGWQLMDSRSEVLFSFLEHTIKTDEALLLAMPKPDGDRAADCSDQRMPGDDAAERILKRRTELEARIQLSEKVLEVLKMEKQ